MIKFTFVYCEIVLQGKGVIDALGSSYKLVRDNQMTGSIFMAFLLSGIVLAIIQFGLGKLIINTSGRDIGLLISYVGGFITYMVSSGYYLALTYSYYQDAIKPYTNIDLTS
ncbi:MAG: hypothetical protein ACOC2J_03040 [bacterium]